MGNASPDDQPRDSVPAEPPPVVPYATPATPTLGYATPAPVETMIISRCANVAEAEMVMNALTNAGIPAQVVDKNTEMLGLYIGGIDVKVLVFKQHAERAAEVLRLATSDELEPADDEAPRPTDEEGQALALEVVGRFNSPRLMRDAVTVLGAANIRAWPPNLVPRGDRPAGEGRRFLLRVQEDDAERARSILADAEQEADQEQDGRCPKCRSWRIYPIGGFLHRLAMSFGFAQGPVEGYECLACKYRGTKEEFEAA